MYVRSKKKSTGRLAVASRESLFYTLLHTHTYDVLYRKREINIASELGLTFYYCAENWDQREWECKRRKIVSPTSMAAAREKIRLARRTSAIPRRRRQRRRWRNARTSAKVPPSTLMCKSTISAAAVMTAAAVMVVAAAAVTPLWTAWKWRDGRQSRDGRILRLNLPPIQCKY